MFGIDDIAIGAVAGPLIGGALGMIGQEDTNSANAANVKATNEMNYKIAQERNAAQEQLQQGVNDTNIRLASENRDWQQTMSNTAYQRQVGDMRAAGLNPILAAMRGGGASTPAGSVAQVSAPNLEAPTLASPVVGNSLEYLGKGVEQAANSAVAAYNAETKRGEAGSYKTQVLSQAGLNQAHADKVNQEIENLVNNLDNVKVDTRLKLASINEVLSKAGLNNANAELSAWSAKEAEQRYSWNPSRWSQDIAESKERTKYIGATWQNQVGEVLKDAVKRAGGGLNLWDGLFGDSHRNVSNVYGSGGGNVYGGANSALKYHLDRPITSWPLNQE